MQLVENYKKYYATPSLKNAKCLRNSIFEYDYINYDKDIEEIYEIFKYSTRRCKDKFKMNTSGSTGKFRFYDFGPLPTFWIRSLEKYVKNTRGIVCLIHDPFLTFPNTETEFMFGSAKELKMPQTIKFNYQCVTNYKNKENYKFMINSLSCLIDKFGSISLTMNPNCLFLYNNLDYYEDFINKYKDKINSISTTGWTPINTNQNIVINNNMINWVNGTNFYTCNHNQKHFLPLFYSKGEKCFNLLNLIEETSKNDDDFIIHKGIKKCNCGKNRLDFSFTPHKEHAIRFNKKTYLPDVFSKNKIIKNTLFFQCVQKKEYIDVLYIGEPPIHVIDFWEKENVKANLVENKFITTGVSKFDFFWKGENKYLNIDS